MTGCMQVAGASESLYTLQVELQESSSRQKAATQNSFTTWMGSEVLSRGPHFLCAVLEQP